MAQTKKKRRRKHRGTQGGGIATRPRGRPQNRAEAKQRAQARQSKGSKGKKSNAPSGARPIYAPSWSSAAKKGVFAGLLFFALTAFLFQRPLGGAIVLSSVMMLFYIPMGYYVDTFMWRRQQRKIEAEKHAKAQARSGSKD